MKQIEQIMGMPIIINLPGSVDKRLFRQAFDMFRDIDDRFSPYKPTSEVAEINRTKHTNDTSADMREVLELAEQTKQTTNGYFDVWHNGTFDPSGIVKGWAIQRVADWLRSTGTTDCYVEAGGDLMVYGKNDDEQPWRIGIRNPFNREEVVKVVTVSDMGMATSGTAIRGQHIYNPHETDKQPNDIVSLTVIAPTAYDADRLATAAFAMGAHRMAFIQNHPDLEGYMINADGVATMTAGFERYVLA